jgi:hypothetical protein
MRYHELVHFSWVRWLLDEQGECEHRVRLIMKELDSFFKVPILSSQMKLHSIKEALDGAERRFARPKAALCPDEIERSFRPPANCPAPSEAAESDIERLDAIAQHNQLPNQVADIP